MGKAGALLRFRQLCSPALVFTFTLISRQFQRFDLNLMAISSQGCIVIFLFISLYVHFWTALTPLLEADHSDKSTWLYRVIGFRELDELANAMIVTLIFYLSACVVLLLYQALLIAEGTKFRLVESGQLPILSLARGKQYHLCTWSRFEP